MIFRSSREWEPRHFTTMHRPRQRKAAVDHQDQRIDFEPVVQLFSPDGNAIWLITEIYNPDINLAFGLYDLGIGRPELGYVILSELAEARGPRPEAHSGFPSSAIFTSHRHARSQRTRSLPASIGASSPETLRTSRRPSGRRFLSPTTGSLSASRRILTICSSENRVVFMASSNPLDAILPSINWSETRHPGHRDQ